MPWSDESKFEMFSSTQRVFVPCRKVKHTVYLYMHGYHCEAWRSSEGDIIPGEIN